jgi:SAM-dependent methyltransferase
LGEIVVLVGRQHPARLVAVDVSERAAAATALAVKQADLSQRISVALADCYRLGFGDAAFDAVISFGYASAASYEGAESEVARVLRPGGVAIIDFRNVSVYNTLLNPRAGLRMWQRFRRRDKVYHFGPIGLAEHFARRGLELEAVRYFNTYPPLGNVLPVSAYLALDRVGRRVGRPFGRVLIAKFRRTNDSL